MPRLNEHLKSMAATIDMIRYYPSQAVFTDFVEMAAIAIRNAFDMAGRDEREARYLLLIAKYKPEDQPRFAILVQQLTAALDEHPCDILGELYMRLRLANEKRGQFFTPPSIANLLSTLTINPCQIRSEVARKGFITLSEPSCGSGAMVIAYAFNMLEQGINYQQHLHVTLVDVDIRAVHMAFIQLSLLHIPAIVVHGNTLTVEEFSHWPTLAHAADMWSQKLKRGFSIDSQMGDSWSRTGSCDQQTKLELPLLAHIDQAEAQHLQGNAL